MTQDGCLKRSTSKTAGATVYLMEELGDARMRCDQLVRYVDEATKLLENISAEEKEHLFEAAGHLVQSIPGTLFKLQKALQAVALAATRIDYEELKEELKPEKVEQLEKVLQDVRIRHVQRRSLPWTVEQASAIQSLAKQASMLLGDLETMKRTAGEWKVGHDWTGVLSTKGGMDKAKVRRWMQQNLKRYVDHKTDEANTTQMAEEAASEFDLYDGNDIPEEVFELAQDVAEKGGHGVRLAAKRPTFEEARKVLFDHLKEKGWKLSSPDMKVPHATSPDGEVRLWFKTQAVYMSIVKGRGISHTLQGARSIHVDIRDLSPEQFMSKVQSWSKDASSVSWKVASDDSLVARLDDKVWQWGLDRKDELDALAKEANAASKKVAGLKEKVRLRDIEKRAQNGVRAVLSIFGDLKTASDESKESKFEEGKPADPTKNMSPEDAKKWKAQTEEHKDEFKSAAEKADFTKLYHEMQSHLDTFDMAWGRYERDPVKNKAKLGDALRYMKAIRQLSDVFIRNMQEEQSKTASTACETMSSEDEKQSKFEKGKPADPTENMDPEDAKKWKSENDRNKDRFKSAAAWKV